MNLKKALVISRAIFKACIFKKNIPIVVRWRITSRCNLRCKYCKVYTNVFKELTTEQILKAIDILQCWGTQRIAFAGGEPLLRDDIADIISYASLKGIHTEIYTNGVLLPAKIKSLKGLKLVRLSFDGPEEIHDSIREAGTHRKTMEAIRICGENNIKVLLSTALTKYNLKYVDYIVNTAKIFNAQVVFYPILTVLLGTDEPNPLSPDLEEYKEAVNKIIKAKAKTRGNIYNSSAGLQYLYNFPVAKKSYCIASLISCYIQPNGDLQICPNITNKIKLNIAEIENVRSFNDLHWSFKGLCRTPCWRVRVIECNNFLRFNLNTIKDLLKAEL